MSNIIQCVEVGSSGRITVSCNDNIALRKINLQSKTMRKIKGTEIKSDLYSAFISKYSERGNKEVIKIQRFYGSKNTSPFSNLLSQGGCYHKDEILSCFPAIAWDLTEKNKGNTVRSQQRKLREASRTLLCFLKAFQM